MISNLVRLICPYEKSICASFLTSRQRSMNNSSTRQLSNSNETKNLGADKHEIALLLIDVINHLDFEGNEELIKVIEPIGRRIFDLKKAAHRAGIPTIYVNDNFHKWKSDFRHVVEEVLEKNKPGKILAELLCPNDDDYFVLKPKHSGFYGTPLQILLEHLQTKKLILTGFAGNICVLFTANDAYMRNYELIVPRDCIGSNTPAENDACLDQMEKLLKADVRPSIKIVEDLKKI